jgi:hypothetical protein
VTDIHVWGARKLGESTDRIDVGSEGEMRGVSFTAHIIENERERLSRLGYRWDQPV